MKLLNQSYNNNMIKVYDMIHLIWYDDEWYDMIWFKYTTTYLHDK